MDQWEYLFVTCGYIGLFTTEWLPRYINGVEVEGWQQNDNLFIWSNARGREGWELVNTFIGYGQHGTIYDYRLVFKRPYTRAVTTETHKLTPP